MAEGAPAPIRVLIISFNLGNSKLSDWSQLIEENGGNYDLVAVGLQESRFKIKAPKRASQDGGDDDRNEGEDENSDDEHATEVVPESKTDDDKKSPRTTASSATPKTKPEDNSFVPFLQSGIESRLGSEFFLVDHVRRLEMQLFVFCNQSRAAAISAVEKSAENTGFLHLFPNKGGVCISCNIGPTSFAFISCHLAAHDGMCTARNNNLEEIFEGCRIGEKTTSCHHVFIWGDLNYRVDYQLNDKQANIERGLQDVAAGNYEAMIAHDELIREINANNCLTGFTPCPIRGILPTFKVIKGQEAGYSSKRTPGFTDRICHKSMPGFAKNMHFESFQAFPGVITSDHKPVRAVFSVEPSAEAKFVKKSLSAPLIEISNLRCQNLSEMDPQALGGGSDPYISFHTNPPMLLNLMSSGSSDPTPSILSSIKWHNLNPVWSGETFLMKIMTADGGQLGGVHLELAVWDKDLSSQDDLIGVALISLSDIIRGAALRKSYAFEKDLTNNGKIHGKIMGTVRIATDGRQESMRMDDDEEKRPNGCCLIA